jgi:hypothetical protein
MKAPRLIKAEQIWKSHDERDHCITSSSSVLCCGASTFGARSLLRPLEVFFGLETLGDVKI